MKRQEKQFINILENMINGNHSDAKKAIKKLNKKTLIEFLVFHYDYYNQPDREDYQFKILLDNVKEYFD